MLPGPDYVYQCPTCSHLLKNESLMSGNTFGEKIFSDGKREAPMFPEFPDLTKCKKCHTIFWLSKLEEIGTWYPGESNHPEWQNADKAAFLDIDDYFRAIQEGIAENAEDELYIRQSIWWAYNDKIRDGHNLFDNEADESRWLENIKKLTSLLDPSDSNQQIMLAEIHRNLGDFDSCIRIMESIDNEELNWLKEKFLLECQRKNRWVIKLN